MKIGIIIKNYAVGEVFDKSGMPNKCGAEFHAENHGKLFTEKGNQVYIMTKKSHLLTKGRETLNGMDVVRLHAPFRWLESILRLYTTHKNTDAFYILGIPSFAVWIIKAAQWQHKPTTLVLTNTIEIFNREESWRHKIFAQCDNYIAISQEIADGLVQQTGIDRSRVHVIPQGIDAAHRFCPAGPEEKAALRKELGISPDKPVVLFCARVAPIKGIGVMLDAWRIIHKQRSDALLLVVGGGLNTLIEEIKKVSRNEADNSILVTGEVEKPDNYYRMSDIYFLPSEFEGLPTTLMEAMGCGLASVASDIGGSRDLVQHGKTGYLADKHDATGFAAHILRLLDDKALREKMGEAGRQRAIHELDYQVIVKPVLDVIATKQKE